MIDRIRRLLTLPPRGRAVLGALLGAPSALYLLTTALSGWERRWLLPIAVILFAVGGWLGLPWLSSLPSHWDKKITSVTLVIHNLWVAAMVTAAVLAARSGDPTGPALLIGLWAGHFFYPAFEPTAHALGRLRGRLGRAVHWRVAMMVLGITGAVWFAHSIADGDDKYRLWANGLTVTLVLGGSAASLKVYARFRKLCTALHRQSQALVRSLEEHQAAADEDERKKKGQEVRRAWDVLHELLLTRADTGFYLPGVFVLPPAEIEAMEQRVMAAVDTAFGDGLQEASAEATQRLRVIQAACRGRIDATA